MRWDKHQFCRRLSPVGSFDRETRTVASVLATGAKIDGPFGPEILSFAPEAIDMSRAREGLPWHDSHSMWGTGEHIGIVENVRVEGEQLVGTLRASRNGRGEEVLTDIEDGIIKHTSIGYRILDAHYQDDILMITHWMPLEVSTPSVVADTDSRIARAMTMTEPTTDPGPVSSEDHAAQIRQYAADLDAVFTGFPDQSTLRSRAFSEGWAPDRARQELLAVLGANYRPSGQSPDIVPGEDVIDKFTRAAGQAIQTRARLIVGEDARNIRRENEFFGYSLAEIAREYLRVAGDSVRGDTRQIVGMALTRAGIISHSTSDFANLLVDASNKALQKAYAEAPETFEAWTASGTLPDFKIAHRPQLSTFSDLDTIAENGEYTYGTFSDAKETIQLVTYGKLFSITRQAIINDDLNAFIRAPSAMARAAKRKIGDAVYSVLSTNGNMSDGNALFSAAHSNYVAAGSGGAPAVGTLNTAYASMATQTDPAGNTLNATPTYIMTAHALRGTVDALLQSALDPAEGGVTAFQAANIWRARLEPVYEARIDADDAAKWYLAGNPAAFETIEVAYLNGVQEPRLEREEGFTVDGVTLKVAHDAGVSPIDWRFLYHNDGN